MQFRMEKLQHALDMANVENTNLQKENSRLQSLMSEGEKRGDKIKQVTKQVHAFKEQIDAAQ